MKLRWITLAVGLSLSGCGGAESSPRTGAEHEGGAGSSTVEDPSDARLEAARDSSGETTEAAEDRAGDGAGESSRAATCPATYAEARRLGVDCERESGPRCSYPEGRCACERRTRCSGVPPRPGETEPRIWMCRDTPPAVRPNGCPGSAPREGEPCSVSAPFCDYGECHFTRYQCLGGRWQRGITAGPPRSAPR